MAEKVAVEPYASLPSNATALLTKVYFVVKMQWPRRVRQRRTWKNLTLANDLKGKAQMPCNFLGPEGRTALPLPVSEQFQESHRQHMPLLCLVELWGLGVPEEKPQIPHLKYKEECITGTQERAPPLL